MSPKRVFTITSILAYTFFNVLFGQSLSNENVKFVLDCWRYNFGLKTYGGGYIRHILLFSDSHIVNIETSQISKTPNYSNAGHILAVSLLYHSRDLTVENFINTMSSMFRYKIRRVLKYDEITKIEIKRKGEEIHLTFTHGGGKEKFISKHKHDNSEEIEIALRELLFDAKTSQSSYLYVYAKETETVKTESRKGVFLEVVVIPLPQERNLSQNFLSLALVNYDNRRWKNLSYRIGIGTILPFPVVFVSPISMNLLIGSGEAHHLELGAGIALLYALPLSFSLYSNSSSDQVFIFPVMLLNFGYRYQPSNGAPLFRLSLNMTNNLIGSRGRLSLVVYPSISIGYTF